MKMHEDPNWPKASTWLKDQCPADLFPDKPLLVTLGVPLSQGSITPNASHRTPKAVRAALARFSPFAAGVGWPRPRNVDLNEIEAIDLGDLPLQGLENVAAQETVERAMQVLQEDPRLPRPPDLVVLLGGDNSLTRPALKGLTSDLGRAGLLTLDAHHDVREFYAGPTNGTPVRGLTQDGLPPNHIVQIGMGAFSNSQFYRNWVDERGITVVSAAEALMEGAGRCVERHLNALSLNCDRLYVDLDLDVLDSVFAPGCPGARPGGLIPRELHDAALAAGRHEKVIGIDIVEVDASRDPMGISVDNAALCLLYVAAGLAMRSSGKARPTPKPYTAKDEQP